MNLLDRIIIFVATGCYSGKSPVAPGTAGTLLGLIPALLISRIDLVFGLIIVFIITVFAIPISDRAEKMSGSKDPGFIVIDEIVGIMITFITLPFTMLSAVLGFILFRFFDIIKPYPVGMLDRRLSGGTGIVLDDVAAGIMANIALRIILSFVGI